jgi:hypothetical protein
VIVARLTSSIGNPPVGKAWGDTGIRFSNSVANLRCVLHGTAHVAESGVLLLRDVLSALPVAVLVGE